MCVCVYLRGCDDKDIYIGFAEDLFFATFFSVDFDDVCERFLKVVLYSHLYSLLYS